MSRSPKVTVATVTHNGAQHLAETIASVRAQTFDDFEYIVVDNASHDASAEILAAAAREDHRLRVIRVGENLGPAAGLNVALREARGSLFANLDHDDRAHPDRLRLQCAVLDADPALGVCGGWERRIDDAGRVLGHLEYAVQHEAIHWRLSTQCEIRHSAATMRTDLLRRVGGYTGRNWTACDFDLFLRLRAHTRFANQPTTLVDYRVHATQASQQRRQQQRFTVVLLLAAHLRSQLAVPPTLEELHDFLAMRSGMLTIEAPRVQRTADFAERLTDGYIDTFEPTDEVRRLAHADSARLLADLAIGHRRIHHDLARRLFRRALDIDPQWTRSRTVDRIRRAD